MEVSHHEDATVDHDLKTICPECGKELLDQNMTCMNCGFVLKKAAALSDKRKRLVFIIVISAMAAVIFLALLFYMIIGNSKKRYAQKLIEADLGIDIICTAVYYNLEDQLCFVDFQKGNTEDVAMVNLVSKEIGYDSVMTGYINESEKYSDYKSEGYQEAAGKIVNYHEYDVTAYYAAQDGRGGWEQIFP